MRQTKRDKQNMFYSNFVGVQKEYERDENGDIVYVEVDGEMIPTETGIVTEVYSEPVPFKCSISSNLNEMHIKSWGVDQSSIYSELACKKGYLKLEIGSIIWRTSKIVWEDAKNKIPKASSSDYTVCGLMDEGLTEDFFLLRRNSSDEENNNQNR